MKTRWAFIIVFLLLACCSAPTQSLAKGGLCAGQSARKGWGTYVNRTHGFCISYPSIYKPVPNGQGNNLATFQRSRSEAKIIISFDDKPFDLQSFISGAPTGVEGPPESVRVGQLTFYYYGPGGGGAQYPDQYFFNLRGKTLQLLFDGPYVDNKTPSAETKKIEREMLATFSIF